MSESSAVARSDAGKRYQSARRKAIFDELFSLVRRRSPELLSFEQVQTALQAWQQIEGRQPEVIPLDKIVGSVGRYKDFTREFLPRDSISASRWRAVAAAMHSPLGLPPIEVYQVGEIFFVKDGKIHTPKPDCFLDGITRRTVIDLAQRRGIEVVERAIMPEELAGFEQCFLSGTAAEVTPVSEIGPYRFEVGEIAKTLMNDYSAEVQPKHAIAAE